ncbi:hypothetical protein ACJIZ3_023711 [Penstemon smallii]|uniref:Uncharacterized protein n=1 Tax=Penstemon smallii TaxID=265156 RepID=A0ABD3TPZ9_9LAMI
MFEYYECLKFQATIYQRGGCEPSFMLKGNSMVQVELSHICLYSFIGRFPITSPHKSYINFEAFRCGYL